MSQAEDLVSRADEVNGEDMSSRVQRQAKNAQVALLEIETVLGGWIMFFEEGFCSQYLLKVS